MSIKIIDGKSSYGFIQESDEESIVIVFPCVRSGHCCKMNPCPHGDVDESLGVCKHLAEQDNQHLCLIYDKILELNPSNSDVAFGKGCPIPLNPERLKIVKDKKLMGDDYFIQTNNETKE